MRLRIGLLAAACGFAIACSSAQLEPLPGPSRTPHPLGLKWDWGRADAYRPYLERLGGGSTFYEVFWCEIEPRPGRRDWSGTDDVVRRSNELGFGVALKIRIGSCWATGDPGGARDARLGASSLPEDMGDYRRFVGDAVRRYAERGVLRYAIENEVNADQAWTGTVSDYVRLARVGAEAVRAAHPEAEVFDSGAGSTTYGVLIAEELLGRGDAEAAVGYYSRYYRERIGTRGERIPAVPDEAALRDVLELPWVEEARSLVEETLRLVREGTFDALQLHYYEPADALPELIDFLSRRLGEAPFEVWELGIFDRAEIDLHAQTEQVTRKAAAFVAAGARAVVYLPAAFNPSGRREREIRWGLLSPEGTPRPAADALLRLAALMRSPASFDLVDAGGVHGLAVGRAGGSVLVVWSDGGRRLPAAPGGADARDLGGRPVPWGDGGLSLGSAPLILEVDLPPEEAVEAIIGS